MERRPLRLLAAVGFSAVAMIAVACGDTGVTPVSGARASLAAGGGGITLTVSPIKAELGRGETLQLTNELTNPAGKSVPSNRPIEWSSSRPEFATVSDDGLVTAVSVGVTTISATGGNATGTATIFVTDKKKCKPTDPNAETKSLPDQCNPKEKGCCP